MNFLGSRILFLGISQRNREKKGLEGRDSLRKAFDMQDNQLLFKFDRVESNRTFPLEIHCILKFSERILVWEEWKAPPEPHKISEVTQKFEDLWKRGPREYGVPLVHKRSLKEALQKFYPGNGFSLIDEVKWAGLIQNAYSLLPHVFLRDHEETKLFLDRIETGAWDDKGNGGGRSYSLEQVYNDIEMTEWLEPKELILSYLQECLA